MPKPEVWQRQWCSTSPAFGTGCTRLARWGVRNSREMRTVGECLDARLRGDLSTLGDMLMQRLKAIEQATKDGHWQVARHLEVCDQSDLGLAADVEVQAAVDRQIRDGKLRDAIQKAKKEK